MYMSIDRKLENDCKIHNACCSHSGIIMRPKLVKIVEEEANQLREV